MMESSQAGAPADDDGVVFAAVLHPYASLSPQGFLLLMAALAGLSFAAGMAFVVAGAWPVFGFFGLDVVLVYAAFRVSYRRARRYETVRLTGRRLTVERIEADGGTRRWEFQPYWLRILMDDPPRPGSALRLSSHGRTLEIGAFLTPREKLEMAQALGAELRRLRCHPAPP